MVAALKELDEITLLEVLDLHADEIVDKFKLEIEERFDELRFKVEGPSAPPTREEERYEPLSGELSWIAHQETPDFDDDDGRS